MRQPPSTACWAGTSSTSRLSASGRLLLTQMKGCTTTAPEDLAAHLQVARSVTCNNG